MRFQLVIIFGDEGIVRIVLRCAGREVRAELSNQFDPIGRVSIGAALCRITDMTVSFALVRLGYSPTSGDQVR